MVNASRPTRNGSACSTMNHAILGLLLSGLVFPGLGQLALKSWKKAFIFISITLISFISIIITTINQANTAMEKIQAEGGKIDLDSVSQAMNQALSASDQLIYSVAYSILVICWLAGVMDAYRTGKNKDRQQTPADK